MTKTYSELCLIDDYQKRIEYLMLNYHDVGEETFGGRRFLNQLFYSSPEWRAFRRKIVLRDNGCDVGHPDHPISGSVYVHHINPVTLEQIESRDPLLLSEDNAISVSFLTHTAIHYKLDSDQFKQSDPVERTPYDTCPWRR